jgi:hypothetical protein
VKSEAKNIRVYEQAIKLSLQAERGFRFARLTIGKLNFLCRFSPLFTFHFSLKKYEAWII